LTFATQVACLLLVLALGVYFRFADLGGKLYWFDETWTAMLLSGHTYEGLQRTVSNNRETDPEELQRYQHVAPGRGVLETLVSVMRSDTHNPPLYPLLLRLWAAALGDSVAALRALSALCSVLALPLAWWLGRELFNSSRAGWLAAGLMAASPLHVLYAQEARSYSLFVATTLASSLALLRALRLARRQDWALYCAAATAGLYTNLLFLLVMATHAVWVVATAWRPGPGPLRLPAALRRYVWASVAAVGAFAPWALLILRRARLTRVRLAWTAEPPGVVSLLKSWVAGLGRVFFDVPTVLAGVPGEDRGDALAYAPFILACLIAVCAMAFLLRTTARRSWLPVLTLSLLPALPLVAADLILGGRRSAIPKYLFPSFLGVQLAVAYLLAKGTESTGALRRRLWQGGTAILLLGGLVSCAVNSRVDVPWHRPNSRDARAVARALNQCQRPLVITTTSGSNAAHMFVLSYLLEPKVRIRFVVEPSVPAIPEGVSEVFLFDPSPALRQALEKQADRSSNLVPGTRYLWALTR
jgi:uncharacterized membrane protein